MSLHEQLAEAADKYNAFVKQGEESSPEACAARQRYWAIHGRITRRRNIIRPAVYIGAFILLALICGRAMDEVDRYTLSPLLIVVSVGVFTILIGGLWLVAKLMGDD